VRASESPFLEGHVGMQLDLGCLDSLVAESEGDHAGVDTGMQRQRDGVKGNENFPLQHDRTGVIVSPSRSYPGGNSCNCDLEQSYYLMMT
jgi:hypothetical protein